MIWPTNLPKPILSEVGNIDGKFRNVYVVCNSRRFLIGYYLVKKFLVFHLPRFVVRGKEVPWTKLSNSREWA